MKSKASIGGHPIHPILIPFPIGLLVFSVITLFVFIASFYLRTTSGATWIAGLTTLPIILSIIGVIGLGIAGWLGGELVFRHGVAVNTQTETAPEKPEAQRHIRAA